MTADKLRKSCRTYRDMLARIPLDPRSPKWREAHVYLRSLYLEFGRGTVREALREFQP